MDSHIQFPNEQFTSIADSNGSTTDTVGRIPLMSLDLDEVVSMIQGNKNEGLYFNSSEGTAKAMESIFSVLGAALEDSEEQLANNRDEGDTTASFSRLPSINGDLKALFTVSRQKAGKKPTPFAITDVQEGGDEKALIPERLKPDFFRVISHPHPHGMELLNRLRERAKILRIQGRSEEAIACSIDALDHCRLMRAFDERYTAIGLELIEQLVQFAIDHPTSLLSYRAAATALSMRHDLDPSVGFELTRCLHRYAIELAEYGNLSEVIRVGREAASQCRSLIQRENTVHALHALLALILKDLARYLLKSGADAASTIEECIINCHICCEKAMGDWVTSLSSILLMRTQAMKLMESKQLEKLLELVKGIVLLARDHNTYSPSICARSSLAKALATLARCLWHQQKAAETSAILAEIIDLRKEIFCESPTDLHRLELVTDMELSAIVLWLSSSRPNGFALAEEALAHERQLFQSEPRLNRPRLARWLFLLRYAGVRGEPLSSGEGEIASSALPREAPQSNCGWQIELSLPNLVECAFHYRVIHEDHSGDSVVELLDALHVLAEDLVTLGEIDHALPVTEEAFVLAQDHSASVQEVRDRLTAVTELRATVLQRAGRHEEALKVLARQQPPCNPALVPKISGSTEQADQPISAKEVLSIFEHAIALAEAGETTRAIKAGRETVKRCRSLFEQEDPQSRRPRMLLAACLANLAKDLVEVGENLSALPLLKEFVTHCRILYKIYKGDWASKLSEALHAQATVLWNLEQPGDAVPLLEEAVLLARQHTFTERSLSSQDSLAAALTMLAQCYSRQESSPDSSDLFSEAIALRREMFHESPTDHHCRDLADSIEQYAIMICNTNSPRAREGIDLAEEALVHERQLFDSDPSSNRLRLAKWLFRVYCIKMTEGRLGISGPSEQEASPTDDQHEGEQCVASEQQLLSLPDIVECAFHYRILCELSEEEHTNELVDAICVHAEALVSLDQANHAVSLTEEALTLSQKYAPFIPEVHEKLKSVIRLHTRALCRADRHQEALKLQGEAGADHHGMCMCSQPNKPDEHEVGKKDSVTCGDTTSNGEKRDGLPPDMDIAEVNPVALEIWVECLLVQAREYYSSSVFAKAADLLAESLPHLRILAGEKHHTGDIDNLIRLAHATRFYAIVQSNLGHESAAIASAAEHLNLLSQLESVRPGEYQGELARGVECFNTNLKAIGTEKYPEYEKASFLRPLADMQGFYDAQWALAAN
ncbi:hypothetical protein DL93DRAFT_2081936 [Clavulina sp. PMI_390]|nr:hypothetical protein DL93DRAFT_2081936 [Clavulina sp. PMI_390]